MPERSKLKALPGRKGQKAEIRTKLSQSLVKIGVLRQTGSELERCVGRGRKR